MFIKCLRKTWFSNDMSISAAEELKSLVQKQPLKVVIFGDFLKYWEILVFFTAMLY